MKVLNVFFVFLFFFCASSFLVAQEEVEVVRLKVEVKGLSCPFCAYGLEKRLRELPGVQSVEIFLKSGEVLLRFTEGDQPTEEEVRTAVEQAGFEVGRFWVCQQGELCDF